MTSISTRSKVVTLINVFTVAPEKQQALVDLLNRATETTMRHLPGFVSANIHRSLDGVRVTNYAQWRSREDFEAMLQNPAAAPHLKEASALATSVEPHLYEVSTAQSRRHGPRRMAAGAVAIGALAVGAFAIGTLAVGRVAIGALAVGRARVGKLSLGHVEVDRLTVHEHIRS